MRTFEVYHEPDSPVLVLAGPLGSTLDIWQPQVEALSEQVRVLRYDHRGHGRSPVLHGGSYGIMDLSLDALALLDRLGIEQASCYGPALGGMVGVWLAAHGRDSSGRRRRLVHPGVGRRAPGRGRAGHPDDR